jgi:hypothetical protein
MTGFNKTELVLIECQEMMYTKFIGQKRTMKIRSERNLTAEEIEWFRTDPEGFFGEIS